MAILAMAVRRLTLASRACRDLHPHPNVGQEFCVDLGFVDAGFTLRDAISCFVRSRMQAVDECSRPNRNPDPDP